MAGEILHIIDPMNRTGKVDIPADFIIPTLGMQEYMDTVGQRDYSLCLLFQAGNCNAGDRCHQIHVPPEYVSHLRQQATGSTCCRRHGDARSNEFEYVSRTAAIPELSLVVPAHGQKQTYVLEPDLLARTLALDALLDRQTFALPATSVCRLHQQERCRFGRDCKNIHICRDFYRMLAAVPGVTGLDFKGTRAQGPGGPSVAAPTVAPDTPPHAQARGPRQAHQHPTPPHTPHGVPFAHPSPGPPPPPSPLSIRVGGPPPPDMRTVHGPYALPANGAGYPTAAPPETSYSVPGMPQYPAPPGMPQHRGPPPDGSYAPRNHPDANPEHLRQFPGQSPSVQEARGYATPGVNRTGSIDAFPMAGLQPVHRMASLDSSVGLRLPSAMDGYLSPGSGANHGSLDQTMPQFVGAYDPEAPVEEPNSGKGRRAPPGGPALASRPPLQPNRNKDGHSRRPPPILSLEDNPTLTVEAVGRPPVEATVLSPQMPTPSSRLSPKNIMYPPQPMHPPVFMPGPEGLLHSLPQDLPMGFVNGPDLGPQHYHGAMGHPHAVFQPGGPLGHGGYYGPPDTPVSTPTPMRKLKAFSQVWGDVAPSLPSPSQHPSRYPVHPAV